MPNLENLKKQAKLLLRWHREGNYSIGGRLRKLPRYAEFTDRQALDHHFTLSEAQEILAVEHGYAAWADLKAACVNARPDTARPDPTSPVPDEAPRPASSAPAITQAIPILFVSNVEVTADFFREKLGFEIDFLHGNPPFYGAVSRDSATLHLRFVHKPPIDAAVRESEQLLDAFLQVTNLKALFAEYKAAGVTFAHDLRKEAWEGSAFIVLDLDGNQICFAE